MKLTIYNRTKFQNYIRPLFIKDKCECCEETENLELHHMKQFTELLTETVENDLKLQYIDDIEYYTKEELNNIKNIMLGKQLKIACITLCKECHQNIHKDGGNIDYFKRRHSRKLTKEEKEKEIISHYLEVIKGNKIYVKTELHKELIKKIDLRDNQNRQQKSFRQINAYLQENYNKSILSNTDNTRKLKDGSVNPNRGKVYWTIIYGIVEK